MIILVKGITGSGKTYIASQLKNIKCIDTDDLYYAEYDKKPGPLPQVHKRVVKILQNEIKKNKFIVITGVNMDEIKYDFTYFIKLTNIPQSYKRVITRELLKYKNMSIPNISKMDPNNINLYLRMKYKAGIDPLGLTFNEYKEKYEQKLKKQDPSTIIKTQDDIIKDIIHKFKNN